MNEGQGILFSKLAGNPDDIIKNMITVFALFSPRRAYLISNVFEGALNRWGGLNRGRGLIKFLKF